MDELEGFYSISEIIKENELEKRGFEIIGNLKTSQDGFILRRKNKENWWYLAKKNDHQYEIITACNRDIIKSYKEKSNPKVKV